MMEGKTLITPGGYRLRETGTVGSSITSRTFHSVQFTLYQREPLKLPEYGPFLRGLFGESIFTDATIWGDIFKPGRVDVKPYFMHSRKVSDHEVIMDLRLLGIPTDTTTTIVERLTNKMDIHLGGKDVSISHVGLDMKGFERPELGENVKISFVSPIEIEKQKRLVSLPTLEDIIRSTSRSVNKYCKYYAPGSYPYKISDSLRDLEAPMVHADMHPFAWDHRRSGGGKIPLRGVRGSITFNVHERKEALAPLLSLLEFFQIGKHVSYGFGKVEVTST